MKNTELLKIANETTRQIFKNEEDVKIDVKSIPANGAFIHVSRVSKGGGICNYPTCSQIGFNCKVYAIAGKENVIKKIHLMYGRHA